MFVSIGFSYGQNWQDIGGLQLFPRCMYEDSIDNCLYIGGHFFIAGTDTVAGIAKWDGHQFHALGCGVNWGCAPSTTVNSFAGYVTAIAKYNNEIYVTGDIVLAGNIPVNNIARWNGTAWDSVGHGLQFPGSMLTVIENELYVGGAFDSAGGIKVNSLAKWNGSQWSDVHNMPSFWSNNSTNYVNSVAKYKGELYVGGNFNNNSINDIVRYNGAFWQSVGYGLFGGLSGVTKMEVLNDDLYVAGVIYKVDGNAGNFIQKWDGNQWYDVGGGTIGVLNDPYSNGQIDDMKLHNNELFVAGTFGFAGGIKAQNVARWNGTDWCGFGGIFDSRAGCLGFFKDTLYLGGGFRTIDGDSVNYIAKLTTGTTADTCTNTIGIEQFEAQQQFIRIFPNPATNILYFESQIPINLAEVYDISGKLILTQKLLTPQLDISALAKGMYFIKLTTTEGSVLRKFVKE